MSFQPAPHVEQAFQPALRRIGSKLWNGTGGTPAVLFQTLEIAFNGSVEIIGGLMRKNPFSQIDNGINLDEFINVSEKRYDGRAPNELRPVKFTPDFTVNAKASAVVEKIIPAQKFHRLPLFQANDELGGPTPVLNSTVWSLIEMRLETL